MRKFLVITMAIAMLACSVVGVSAFEADADGFVAINNVEVTGKTLTGEYGLVVIKGLDSEILNLTDANILYIDQTTAADNKVSFGTIGLKSEASFTGATAYIGGENLGTAEKIGNITPILAKSITLNRSTATLSLEGTNEITLTATVLPENAVDKTVTWTSSAPTVATVDNGKVTAVALGTTTITARTANGLEATCSIEVSEKPTVVYGDVNSDTKVTNKDSMALARYLAEWDDYPESVINMANADVNADAKVTNKDSMALARHLAEWDGYEELPYIEN